MILERNVFFFPQRRILFLKITVLLDEQPRAFLFSLILDVVPQERVNSYARE